MQEAFLEQLRHIGPDLCAAAAYGNILPRTFRMHPLSMTGLCAIQCRIASWSSCGTSARTCA